MLGWIRAPGEHGYGTPEGFGFYYLLTSGQPLPPHAAHEWIPGLYEAIGQGYKDIGIEAFRGAIKSSVFSNFLSYQVGLCPWSEYMVVQVMDNSAHDTTKWITLTIEQSPSFRAAFPKIERDPKRGWGAEGYNLRDFNYSDEEWQQLRTRDPSLLGAGYQSGIIIGKHPRRFLWIDDIHNSTNTRSQKELMRVKEIYSKDIRHIRTKDTVVLWSFTPWVYDDLYYNVKKTKKFWHILTPATKEGTWPGTPVWPEQYNEETLQDIHDDPTVGPIAFAQMMLCNIDAKKGQVLNGDWITGYPAEEIDPSWKTIMGVDYASIQEKQDVKGRDYFSLAIGKIHPVSGAIVLIDGVQEHVTQAEAEQTVISKIEQYKRTFFRCMIEDIGKGEEFYSLMLRRYARGIHRSPVGNVKKGIRFEKQLAPAFFDGRMMIARDTGNPAKLPINYDYIDTFVTQWLMYDGSETYPDDTLDAVFHMGAGAKGFMMTGAQPMEYPHMQKENRKKNPISKFGRK